jgi:hypothetical protein
MQEDGDRLICRVARLIDAHVGVVRRDIRPGDEVQAEQAPGHVEHRLHHAVEREVGLDDGLVEVVAQLAHLLGVIAPVPGLDVERLAARELHRAQRLALLFDTCLGRLPHLLQQLVDRAALAGHRVGERVVGEIGVAVQLRLLEPKGEDLAHHRPVVVSAVVFAARHPGAPGGFAQVASVGEGQERHDVRTRQRDHRAAVGHAALGRRLACRGAHERRQSGHFGLVTQQQPVGRFVGELVLRELRGQLGETLHHLRIALPGRSDEPGAGAHEVEMHAVEQAALFSRQGQRLALLVQGVDACEQAGVHRDRAAMLRKEWRHVALDRLQFG